MRALRMAGLPAHVVGTEQHHHVTGRRARYLRAGGDHGLCLCGEVRHDRAAVCLVEQAVVGRVVLEIVRGLQPSQALVDAVDPVAGVVAGRPDLVVVEHADAAGLRLALADRVTDVELIGRNAGIRQYQCAGHGAGQHQQVAEVEGPVRHAVASHQRCHVAGLLLRARQPAQAGQRLDAPQQVGKIDRAVAVDIAVVRGEGRQQRQAGHGQQQAVKALVRSGFGSRASDHSRSM